MMLDGQFTGTENAFPFCQPKNDKSPAYNGSSVEARKDFPELPGKCRTHDERQHARGGH